MSGEIASAYVSLYTKMPGLKSDVGKQLSGVMPAEGQRSGSLFASGMKLALGGAAMMGAINVAKKGLKSIYDVTIGGGIARAMAIDEAQAKLTGLGHTSSDTSSIMNSAIEAVTGTSYALGDAASTAAALSASGVKSGWQMTDVLKTVADVSYISGKSFQDTGAIFTSVMARGKLQGDDMLQLTMAGVPVLSLLARQTGKTSAEVSQMVSKGQIDFATFAAAMKLGMGGAAQASGKTFEGAMKNVKGALGYLGATAMAPFLNGLRQIFVALNPVIKSVTDSVKPMFASVDQGIQRVMPSILAWINRMPGMITRMNAQMRAKVEQLKGIFARLHLPVPKVNLGAMFAGGTAVFGIVAAGVGKLVAGFAPLAVALKNLLPSFGALKGAAGGAWWRVPCPGWPCRDCYWLVCCHVCH